MIATRALATVLASAQGLAHGAGFAVDFVGARSVGSATAGSALAADAATVFFNPAGIAVLERDQWIAGTNLFLLDDRFSDRGSTILGGAAPTPGSNGREAIPTTPVPWVFGTRRLSAEVVAGIGIFSPFGLKTDYRDDFVGRYQDVLTSLKVISVNPVVAYAPTRAISIGAGINVQYADLQRRQSIDFGSACAVTLGPGACAAGFGLVPGRSDGRTELEADDFAVGFNVGVLIKPADRSRLSVAFRSRVEHRFDSARQRFDVPAGARAFLTAGGMPGALTDGKARTSLPLPARLSFGWSESITDDLDVMADATLTMWHVFRRTVVTPDDPMTGASASIEQRYKDAWRFAVGAEYKVNSQWSVRGGIAYDHTPIRLAFMQPALPDRDRIYLSLGASHTLKSNWSVDVGYSYVHYKGKMPIDRSTPNGDTVRGEFDVGGHVIAAQLKFQH